MLLTNALLSDETKILSNLFQKFILASNTYHSRYVESLMYSGCWKSIALGHQLEGSIRGSNNPTWLLMASFRAVVATTSYIG